MSRHTGSCATAMTPGCSCPCLHARHGLEGRLRWAIALGSMEQQPDRTPTPHTIEGRQRQESATERLKDRNRRAIKSKRSRKVSKINSNSAFEYVRTVNCVDWLAQHPTETQQLTAMVELFVKNASQLIEESPEKKRPAVKKRILDHLWCDLVASIVEAVEKIGDLETVAVNKIADSISIFAIEILKQTRSSEPSQTTDAAHHESRADLDAQAGLSLESAILKGCIAGMTKIALKGGVSGLTAYRETLLLKLRIAAVMLCPNILDHDAVRHHCLNPLWQDKVTDELVTTFWTLIDSPPSP